MVRQRVRIRFRKEGDLRLISHRDLARAMERLFRRCKLPLSMTQGFNPHPKISFPLALALGVASLDEVMELELAEEQDADRLHATLNEHSPAGLQFTSVEVLPPGTRKAQVCRATYELPVPQERWMDVSRAAENFLARESYPITRSDNGRTIDARASVEDLAVTDGKLRMTLQVTRGGSTRPPELLEILGLNDLVESGSYLTRTALELESE